LTLQYRRGRLCHLDDLLYNLDLKPPKSKKSPVWAGGYSLYVSVKLLKPFMKYCGNKICPDEWTNAAEGQPKNIMPTGGGGITKNNNSHCMGNLRMFPLLRHSEDRLRM